MLEIVLILVCTLAVGVLAVGLTAVLSGKRSSGHVCQLCEQWSASERAIMRCRGGKR